MRIIKIIATDSEGVLLDSTEVEVRDGVSELTINELHPINGRFEVASLIIGNIKE